MGKANILSKNMYAMAEDGNSNSRPSLIAVDRAEMMRHLDELETAMNQTLQDMRSLVEESKRIPLTNTVMINPTELVYLWAELNKVSLERIFINRKIEDRMKAQEELAELLENYKKWTETYQWNTRDKKVLRHYLRYWIQEFSVDAEQCEYWQQKLKDIDEKMCGQGTSNAAEEKK